MQSSFKIICIVIIITLIYYIAIRTITYMRDKVYNSMISNTDVEKAKDFIKYAAYLPPSSIDSYKLGTIYDFVMADPTVANRHYTDAMRRSIDDDINVQVYIRDRIRDRLYINERAEADDTKYARADAAVLENELRGLDTAIKSKPPAVSEPAIVWWEASSQNVHDSNINSESADQFACIKNYIDQNLIMLWDYTNIMQFVENCDNEVSEHDAKNIPHAVELLRHIRTHNPFIMKIKIKEVEFVQYVFSYLMTYGPDMFKTVLENMLLNMKECYNNGRVVCITGRFTRILSSFADCPHAGLEIGVLKSQQVIKNEILARLGSIRDGVLSEYSDSEVNEYNTSANTAAAAKIQQHIRTSMKEFVMKDYATNYRNNPTFINNVLDEVNACV